MEAKWWFWGILFGSAMGMRSIGNDYSDATYIIGTFASGFIPFFILFILMAFIFSSISEKIKHRKDKKE